MESQTHLDDPSAQVVLFLAGVQQQFSIERALRLRWLPLVANIRYTLFDGVDEVILGFALLIIEVGIPSDKGVPLQQLFGSHNEVARSKTGYVDDGDNTMNLFFLQVSLYLYNPAS